MPTRWTRPTGVACIDKDHRHTGKHGFVDHEPLQLCERPAMERCALRPSSLDPRANMRQSFQRYPALPTVWEPAFGLRNNPFGQDMVDIFGEARFFPRQFPQARAAALCAFPLQLAAQPPM